MDPFVGVLSGNKISALNINATGMLTKDFLVFLSCCFSESFSYSLFMCQDEDENESEDELVRYGY